MPHGFDAHRIFISAPGDLERDRQACHDAIAEVNETVAMPAKLLLVHIGLRDNEDISGNRSIVADNVRWSRFFMQIFEDDWGPRDLFRKLFLLAVECQADPSTPMSEVVVFLKDATHEKNPEILEFRRELAQQVGVRVFRYDSPGELKSIAIGVCHEWTAELIAGGTGSEESPQATLDN